MNTQVQLLWSHGGLQWIGLAIGVGEVAGSLLLASHRFYRAFTDVLTLTDAAKGLPQIQGSDWCATCAK